MSARPMVGRRQELRAFRLDEIPLEARLRAARAVCRAEADSLLPERYGGKRLYGRAASVSERLRALDVSIEVMRGALFPSDEIYRVSREAWEGVCRGARR